MAIFFYREMGYTESREDADWRYLKCDREVLEKTLLEDYESGDQFEIFEVTDNFSESKKHIILNSLIFPNNFS